MPALRERRGFGRDLIEQLLPYELDEATLFAFTADGLCCVIEAPLNIELKAASLIR